MYLEFQIPPPILLNPLKHHLGFIREYICSVQGGGSIKDPKVIIKNIKHIGVSLTDIYSGSMNLKEITHEVFAFLGANSLESKISFGDWAGREQKDFMTILLSDGSEWVMKYFENESRYVHIFPARNSSHTIRAKANTLKSALLYLVFIDKDYITEKDLNKARVIYGLSPVKDLEVAESIYQMIEILRA